MRLQISDRLVNAATHCEKGFSCLKEGKADCCQAIEQARNGLLFVECKKPVHAHCFYAHTIDKKLACTCPVRKELYLQYKM